MEALTAAPTAPHNPELLPEEAFLSNIPHPDQARIRTLRAQHRDTLLTLCSDHQAGIRAWLGTKRGQQAAADEAGQMLQTLQPWLIQDGLGRALELWLTPATREASTVWPVSGNKIDLSTKPTRRFISKSHSDQPTFRQSGRAPAGLDGRYIALTCVCIQHHLSLSGPFSAEQFVAFFDVIHTWIARISALQTQTIEQMGNRSSAEPAPVETLPPTSPATKGELQELEDVVNATLEYLDQHCRQSVFKDPRFAFQLRKLLLLSSAYTQQRFLSAQDWASQEAELAGQARKMAKWPLARAERVASPAQGRDGELLANELIKVGLQCMTPRATSSLRVREALADALYLLSEQIRVKKGTITFGHVFSALGEFS